MAESYRQSLGVRVAFFRGRVSSEWDILGEERRWLLLCFFSSGLHVVPADQCLLQLSFNVTFIRVLRENVTHCETSSMTDQSIDNISKLTLVERLLFLHEAELSSCSALFVTLIKP